MMANLFFKATSFTDRAEIETSADTFLSVAISHIVYRVKVEETPIHAYTEPQKAKLFNMFYKTDLKKNPDAIKPILNMLALEKGINKPKFTTVNTNMFDIRKAAAAPNNEIKFLRKTFLGEYDFVEDIKSAIHESQHLYQYFNTKKFLMGEEVDIKYQIMAFQQIFNYCGIRAPKIDIITQAEYYFNAQEIDARIASVAYLFELAKNKNLIPEAREDILNYIYYNLEHDASLFDSGKKLLKQLDYQTKKFQKIFKDCPLAQDIMQEYNKSRPYMEFYAKNLDCTACSLGIKISKLKKEEKQEMQLAKKQLNLSNSTK